MSVNPIQQVLQMLMGQGGGVQIPPQVGGLVQNAIPIVMQQLQQNPQMLTQMASALMPQQPQLNDLEYSSPFYRFGVPHADVFNPDYQRGTIQEVEPPHWIDPKMEFIEQERSYTPPDANRLPRMPGEEDEGEDPIEQET